MRLRRLLLRWFGLTSFVLASMFGINESAHAGPLAYASGAQTIYVIDVGAATHVGTLVPATPLPEGFFIERIALTPDNQTLVVTAGINCCGRAGEPGRVVLFDTASGTERASITVGARPAGIGTTADSTTAYIGAINSDRIDVLDLTSGVVLRSFDIAAPYTVKLTDDGALLAVLKDAGSVTSLDAATETVHATSGSVGAGNIFDLVPGTHVAWISTNQNNTIRIVDLDTGAFVGDPIAVGNGGFIRIRHQGDLAVVTGEGGPSGFYLVAVPSGTPLDVIPTAGIPYGTDFTADGQTVVAGLYGGGRAVGILDLGTGVVRYVPLPEDAFFAAVDQRPSSSQLGALGPAHLWIGLKNGDDQGTQFDLKVELLQNGNLVATGLKRCITNVKRNSSLATEAVVTFDPFAAVGVNSGDVFALRASTRIGTNPDGSKCSGPGGSHNNATGLRLYYDSVSRPSRFTATIAPGQGEDLYLHSNGTSCGSSESAGVTTRTLDTTAPTVTNAKCKDSGGVNFAAGNPFAAIGTWSLAPQP